jgi:hypothetical protein
MSWTSDYFDFDPPGGWSHFTDRSRHVWQGEHGEELIVSSTVITERWPGASRDLKQRRQLHDELEAGALEAIRSAASHPDLRCVEDLTSRQVRASEQQWQMASETHDGETVFLQGLHSASDGVLLITLEAPRDAGARSIFDRVLQSVKTRTGNQNDG